jgi:hypothetical protein
MENKLHPDCVKRLEDIICESLERFAVSNNNWLDYKSTLFLWAKASGVLPKGTFSEQFKEMLDANPLHLFVTNEISKQIRENNEYKFDVPQKGLKEFEGYHDLRSTAKKLLESFISLPWKYAITFELNENLSKDFTRVFPQDYQLSPKVDLFRPTDDFDGVMPLTSSVKGRQDSLYGASLFFNEARKWNPESSYLKIRCDGYIDDGGQSLTFENILSELKAVLGLALATNILVCPSRWETPFDIPKQSFATIHLLIEDRNEIQATIRLPRAMARIMDQLEVIKQGSRFASEEKWQNYIQFWMEMIALTLRDKKSCNKLLLAGQWFFESYCGHNNLLAFVQNMVVLEILLGGEKKESEKIGLENLLKNRCAFFIGETQAERKRIMDQFERIYDVRSRIVHMGKSRLDDEETVLFHHLQDMSKSVIQKELGLVLKSAQKIGEIEQSLRKELESKKAKNLDA